MKGVTFQFEEGRAIESVEQFLREVRAFGGVSSRYRGDAILDLERRAVNSRTLFPDLDGLAKGLWQTEVIRSAKE